MRPIVRSFSIIGFAAALVLGPVSHVRAAALDDRTHAERSLAAIRASMAEIVRIEDGNDVGHDRYVVAAERARNLLVGRADAAYVAGVGDTGDGVGAIGHIDMLLDRSGSSAWTPALQGAKVNLLAAVVSVTDALHEKQMESYQNDLSQALADISLAIGRASDVGVFGGIEGALASTTLGIPSGSAVVSGCVPPTRAPAYGVTAGRLAFVVLPRGSAAVDLPQHLDVRSVSVRPERIVLFTGNAAEIASLCGHARNAAKHPRERARRVAVTHPAAKAPARSGSGAGAYTAGQAKAGAAVYAQSCVSCHGANLQGSAGPAVAGTEFLKSVQSNGWTFADFRNLVTQQMPLNNAGTLSPKAYADVIAFLLASSCFPAGSVPFPERDNPKFAASKITTPAGASPSDPKLGTCKLK